MEPATRLKPYIARLVDAETLSCDEASEAMDIIMSGDATDAQIAAFLIALRGKGETIDEITGCAEAMRKKAAFIDPGSLDVLDTCGTGGDRSGTFNISTVSALVAAGAGAVVAKHGNRSVSSNCGSADVLKALGVNIEAPPAVVERCLREARIGFLFAPLLHKAMKYAIGPRREVGVRTIFNILGPLTNPARARRQLMGVFDRKLVGLLARVLGNLGAVHAFVVASEDGLDEVSTIAPTHVAEFHDGEVREYMFDAREVGLARAASEDLASADVETGVAIARDVLSGKAGPPRDVVLVNSAFALMAADMAESVESGMKTAADAIDSGRAQEALDALCRVSNSTEG